MDVKIGLLLKRRTNKKIATSERWSNKGLKNVIEELRNFNSSPNTVKLIKSGKMKGERRVTRNG
jgi:hypothetical protein